MALPSSGSISASQLNFEARRDANTYQISFNKTGDLNPINDDKRFVNYMLKRDYYVGSPPATSFSDFYNKVYGTTVAGYAGANTPYIHAYSWDKGYGTKYGNPASLPASACYAINTNYTAGSVATGVNNGFKRTVVGALHGLTSTSRYTAFYAWSDSTGFGSRYNLTGSFPTSSPISSVGGDLIIFNDNGTSNVVIIAGSSTTPNTVAWAWDDATGFGTKYADPASATPDAFGIAKFTLQGTRWGGNGGGSYNDFDVIFGSVSTSADRLSAWGFRHDTGWGTRYSDPASLPTGSVYAITCDDNLNVIAATTGTGTTERRSVAYTFGYLGEGWGTRYTAMDSTYITSSCYGLDVTWSPYYSGLKYHNTIVYALTTTPFVVAMNWYGYGGTGWGTKVADPATLPAGEVNGISWNLDLDVSLGHKVSPFASCYPLPGSGGTATGWGTKYSNPASLPSGDCFATIFF